MFNIFNAEQKIIERLEFATQTEQLNMPAWCKKIVSAQDVNSWLEQATPVFPALLVIYRGASIVQGEATRSIEDHRWLVVLAVSSKSNQRQAGELNRLAGAYLPVVKSALTGFMLDGARVGLVQESAPPPQYSSTLAIFPMQFKATVHFSTRMRLDQSGGNPKQALPQFS